METEQVSSGGIQNKHHNIAPFRDTIINYIRTKYDMTHSCSVIYFLLLIFSFAYFNLWYNFIGWNTKQHSLTCFGLFFFE